MKDIESVLQAIQVAKQQNKSKKDVQRELGISYDSVRKYWDYDPTTVATKPVEPVVDYVQELIQDEDRCKVYAYVFGLYLSNGYAHYVAYNSYRIRIIQNVKYPNLIQEHKKAIEILFHKEIKLPKPRNNCIEMGITSKSIKQLFPQMGKGKKHERKIDLEEWQKQILDKHSKMFIRGMMQTDGCRFLNQQKYVRYSYVNTSVDISNIMRHYCDINGLVYGITIKSKNSKHGKKLNKDLTVIQFKAASNMLLEQIVGPKS